jgi:hypothetical protein
MIKGRLLCSERRKRGHDLRLRYDHGCHVGYDFAQLSRYVDILDLGCTGREHLGVSWVGLISGLVSTFGPHPVSGGGRGFNTRSIMSVISLLCRVHQSMSKPFEM